MTFEWEKEFGWYTNTGYEQEVGRERVSIRCARALLRRRHFASHGPRRSFIGALGVGSNGLVERGCKGNGVSMMESCTS